MPINELYVDLLANPVSITIVVRSNPPHTMSKLSNSSSSSPAWRSSSTLYTDSRDLPSSPPTPSSIKCLVSPPSWKPIHRPCTVHSSPPHRLCPIPTARWVLAAVFLGLTVALWHLLPTQRPSSPFFSHEIRIWEVLQPISRSTTLGALHMILKTGYAHTPLQTTTALHIRSKVARVLLSSASSVTKNWMASCSPCVS